MLEALTLLKHHARRKKKIAVLGDMRELGSMTKIAHKNLADWLMQYADEAILFGHYTREFTFPILKSKQYPAHHFATMSELNACLRSHIAKDSYVLVKGSQNQLFMERAVEAILANPKDVSSLCRRGARWDKLRRKTP
jgi:UDP-N-acetylmuramoyl-tripeptide--D-alanyl-D-alanine ligase